MTYYKLSTDLCQIRRYTTKVPSKQSLVVLYACVTDIVKSIDSVVAAYFSPLIEWGLDIFDKIIACSVYSVKEDLLISTMSNSSQVSFDYLSMYMYM